MNLIEIAEKALSYGYICNHCLGRQFAQLLSGFSNEERGRIVRTAMAMQLEKSELKVDNANFEEFKFRTRKTANAETQPTGKEIAKEEKHNCIVCNNIFDKIPEIIKNVRKETKDVDFDSFHVGVKLSKELLEKEEALWEKSGIDYCESIKNEISREVGKALSREFSKGKKKKEVNFERPDIVILLNLEDNKIELVMNSMFVRGKYKKFAKIPQTKHFCPRCKGIGCKDCNWKGKLSDESVQELIAEDFLKATSGVDTRFHGAGREDKDVLCLEGREFVLEILEPRKRKLKLKEIEKKINKINKKRISVAELEFAKREEVVEVKSSSKNKTYRAVIGVDGPIKKTDLTKLQKLVTTINQRTPERVAQRRADLIRKRKVLSLKAKTIGKNKIELTVKTEAGLYIKELVTGDNNRTKPSVTGLLGKKAEIEKLDVIGFE